MSYKRILALLLCLTLLLCGCNQSADRQPSTEELLAAYATAATAVTQATDLTMQVTYRLDRTVNGQFFSQNYTGSVSYLDLGAESFSASVSQQFKYGSFEAEYTEYYAEGTAYCGVNDTLFSQQMSAEDFLARQLPAVLVDASLYGKVSSHTLGEDTVIVFTGATVPERWALLGEGIQFANAGATAVLDPNGALKQTTYVADMTVDGFLCHLEATVSPDISALPQPLLPESEGTPIEYFDAPRLLLQTVGAVYSADAISAADQETLLCNAAALVQASQRTVDLLGKDSDFMAKSDYSVTITNYTGVPSVSGMVESYRDGTYTYSLNGGTPVVQTDITAQKMRNDCEDLLLSGLFTPEHIQNAQLTDTGDFLYIHYIGNDTFVNDLCSWIYSGIGANLDSYASAVTTDEAYGWLALDKRTGLPTAIGQMLHRTHVIENVSYTLSYEYSLSLQFSYDDAYLNITGALPAEAAPEIAPTPLFYKVTGQDGSVMWLLGTIHVGDAATAYLPQQLTDALAASDALALEIDMDAFEALLETDSQLQTQLAQGYYYIDGTSAADHLDSALWQRTSVLLRASGNYGYATQRMKPALLENILSSFLLQQSYDLSAEKGVEQRLTALAAQNNIPILDIEDPLAHTLLVTGYSPELQAYLLSETLDTTLLNYTSEIRQLYDLWCQGDTAALEQALQEDTSLLNQNELALYEEYTAAMTTARNAIMLEKAIEYLEGEQTVFFAVGLAHVISADGLAAALQTAGYTVEAVSYN